MVPDAAGCVKGRKGSLGLRRQFGEFRMVVMMRTWKMLNTVAATVAAVLATFNVATLPGFQVQYQAKHRLVTA